MLVINAEYMRSKACIWESNVICRLRSLQLVETKTTTISNGRSDNFGLVDVDDATGRHNIGSRDVVWKWHGIWTGAVMLVAQWTGKIERCAGVLICFHTWLEETCEFNVLGNKELHVHYGLFSNENMHLNVDIWHVREFVFVWFCVFIWLTGVGWNVWTRDDYRK